MEEIAREPESYGDPGAVPEDTSIEELSTGAVPEDDVAELLEQDPESGAELPETVGSITGSEAAKSVTRKLLGYWETAFDRRDDFVKHPETAIVQEAHENPPSFEGMSAEEYDNELGYNLLEEIDELKNIPETRFGRTLQGAKMIGAHTVSQTFGPPLATGAGYLFADHIQNPEMMFIPGAIFVGGLGIGAVHGAHSWYRASKLGENLEDQRDTLEEAYGVVCDSEEYVGPKEIKNTLDPFPFVNEVKFEHWYEEDGEMRSNYDIEIPGDLKNFPSYGRQIAEDAVEYIRKKS